MASPELKSYLDALVRYFEQPGFIAEDPIAVPHGFSDPRDQETIGLYAALLAWGRRSTVLAKLAELCERMDYRPYAFVRDFDEGRDAGRLATFRHRTFQPIDALWLTRNLSLLLGRHKTMEALFCRGLAADSPDIGPAIQAFSDAVLHASSRTPVRLRKHVARPLSGSACKRLCMYLRWMVRPAPVDLQIWPRIRKEQLVLPLDVHSGRQARALGLLDRRSNDWKAAQVLTAACKRLCPADPARYDYALFGLGAYGEPAGLAAERPRHLSSRHLHDRAEASA